MEADVPDQLRCPICFEIPQKEIFQCKNGHTVCRDCSTPMVECPQCRVPFEAEKIRNRALEGILDGMQFNCRYKGRGCGAKVSRSEFQNHSENCAHRPAPEAAGQASNWTNALLATRGRRARPPARAARRPAPPRTRTAPGPSVLINGVRIENRPGSLTISFGNNVVANATGNGVGHRLMSNPPPRRRQPQRQERRTFQAERNKTLKFRSMNDALVTGDGGHIVHDGMGRITAEGNKQGIELNGTGDIKVEGDVEEGVELNGAGDVEVTGNVQGGIYLGGSGDVKVGGNVEGGVDLGGSGDVRVRGNVEGGIYLGGTGDVKVEGDVDGDIDVAGFGSVNVQGRHLAGRVYRGHYGTVHIAN